MTKSQKVTDLKKERSKRTMIIKNNDLEFLNRTQALISLSSSKEFPVEFAFNLKKLKSQIIPLIQVYLEQKNELVKKYGDKDKNGELIQDNGNFTFSQGNAQKFAEDFQKLLSIENEIESKKLELRVSDIPFGLLSEEDIESLECIINFKE